jgi:APA family basic amino acid/polyamine antiporter
MAQDGVFFKKAAELNKLVFLNGLSGHSVLGFGFMFTGKYGDLLDFVVIIVLIFYILTILGIFILRKMPDAERPYRAFGYPFYLHST